jgi:hypothetical protein
MSVNVQRGLNNLHRTRNSSWFSSGREGRGRKIHCAIGIRKRAKTPPACMSESWFPADYRAGRIDGIQRLISDSLVHRVSADRCSSVKMPKNVQPDSFES